VLLINCPDPPDLQPLIRAFHQFLIGAAVLIVLQLVFRRWSDRISRVAWRGILPLARKPVICCVLLFLLVIAIRVALLPRLPVPVPGIHDEFSYLMMGDTFVHGRLSNPPHPMWISLEAFHINGFPRYASMFPPAQGLVLAIGQVLGLPWIGVLLSSAAMCAVIYWMLLAWIPPRWALLGAILVWLKFCVVGYWVNSYWGGAVAAVGGALLLGAVTRLLRRPRSRDAVLFALGLAILANSRPYEGLLFSLPAVFVLLRWLFQKVSASPPENNRWRTVALPVASFLLLTAAFMALYNWNLTGNILLFPHSLNVRTYHSEPTYLFEPTKPPLQYHNQQFEDFYNGWARDEFDHTWNGVLCVTWLKTVRYFSAFTWWGLLVALPGLWFAIRDRQMRLPWIMLGFLGVATYLVVWSNSHYAAPATCVVILLILQSLRHLRVMRWKHWRWGAILARTSILLLLVDTASAVIRKDCDTFLWTCQGDISRLVIQRKLESLPGKHLVMVRYSDDHNIHDDWVFNAADIDSSKVVWAREISPEQDAKLFAYFQNRKVWLVTPDTDNTYLEPYTQPPDDQDSAK
jgi:hypothetical protein